MEHKYREGISKAKEELLAAQKILLEEYVSGIRSCYNNLDLTKREIVLNRLEKIMEKINNQKFKKSRDISTRKNLLFTAEDAKKIREGQDLSLIQLSKELNLKRNGYVMLEAYEAGRSTPSNPPRGYVSKKYIKWLKEKGYNPFGL